MIIQLLRFGGADTAAKALNFLLMVLLPLLLDATSYGLVTLLAAIEAILSSLFLLGQDRALLVFLPSETRRRRLVSTSLAICASAGLLGLLLAGAVRLAGARAFLGLPVWPHLIGIIAAAAVFNLLRVAVAIARSEGSAQDYARIRLIAQALKTILVLAFAWLLRDESSYVLGVMIASSVAFVIELPFLTPRATLAVDSALALQNLRFGWPLVFHVLSGGLLSYVDRFILAAIASATDVGIYGLSYTIGACVVFLYTFLSSHFEPEIYRQTDPAECEELLAAYGVISSLMASIAAMGLVLIAEPLLGHFFGPEYAPAARIIPIVLAAHCFHPIYLMANYRLSYHRQTVSIASTSALAAILNVSLNCALIPRLGVDGAALATFGSYLFLSLRLHSISAKWRPTESANRSGGGLRIVTVLSMLLVALGPDKRYSYAGFALLAAASLAALPPHLPRLLGRPGSGSVPSGTDRGPGGSSPVQPGS